jgi:hypothetical protein
MSASLIQQSYWPVTIYLVLHQADFGVRKIAAALRFPVSSFPFPVKILFEKRATGNGKRVNG